MLCYGRVEIEIALTNYYDKYKVCMFCHQKLVYEINK